MSQKYENPTANEEEMPSPRIFSASSLLFKEWLEAEVRKRSATTPSANRPHGETKNSAP